MTFSVYVGSTSAALAAVICVKRVMPLSVRLSFATGLNYMEQKMRFELTTSYLASTHSTIELLLLVLYVREIHFVNPS